MRRIISFFAHVLHWLIPNRGWRARIINYRRGQVTWPIPGRPELPLSCPWPMEWTPFEWAEATELAPNGWIFKKIVCTESGLEAEGEFSANCARCGVPLHVRHANMTDTLSVPACSWCVGSVEAAR